MESLLITGSNGFIGTYLTAHLKGTFKIFQTHKTFLAESNDNNCILMDITDDNLVSQIMLEYKPDIVLHLAANKEVEFCQSNPKEAKRINVDGTENILKACAQVGSFLIFMSSDYVFEGTSGMYAEGDTRRPSTIYGETKKKAEDIIMSSDIKYCICRTGGVYGLAKLQAPLLNWAGEKFRKGQVINAFANVYNSPTCIYSLCQGIEIIAKKRLEGICHIAGSQRVSRQEFLRLYATTYGYDPGLVMGDEYKYTPSSDNYRLPTDLSLNTALSESKLGMKFHRIRDGFEILKGYEP